MNRPAIRLTAICTICLSIIAGTVACNRPAAGTGPYYAKFDEALTRELEPYPPSRALVVGTNLWLPKDYAKKFKRALTLVNVGEERLISFYRIDGYLAVSIPDADNPVPYEQPRENVNKMLLAYGQTPLKPDEQTRWVDLRMRFEGESFRAMSLTLQRLIAVDETNGLELAFRPWIALPETWLDIGGKMISAHELIRATRPRLDVIVQADTLSLRYTRPNPVFSIARLFTRAYPALLGSRRDAPVSGMAVWMDQRRGNFSCPSPAPKVQYCNYEEFHAQ